MDFSESIYLSFLGEVGQEVIGMTAHEFRDLVDSNFESAFEKV